MRYEEGLAELQKLRAEFTHEHLIAADGTESDTRAKVIDRMVTLVLGWPESQIKREENSETGFADYTLRCPKPTLVVEAKRAGTHFAFPMQKERRSYALTSLRSESFGVGEAVRQARGYADDHGIEYACVTNGAQWIVFRAITPGDPWTKGMGVVYRSLEDIEKNFTDFWNLLSYEAVSQHALRGQFASAIRERLSFERATCGRPH